MLIIKIGGDDLDTRKSILSDVYEHCRYEYERVEHKSIFASQVAMGYVEKVIIPSLPYDATHSLCLTLSGPQIIRKGQLATRLTAHASIPVKSVGVHTHYHETVSSVIRDIPVQQKRFCFYLSSLEAEILSAPSLRTVQESMVLGTLPPDLPWKQVMFKEGGNFNYVPTAYIFDQAMYKKLIMPNARLPNKSKVTFF